MNNPLGFDARQAGGASDRLYESGYITGRISGITERGRREVGLWPSPEVGYERLLAKLDELIEASTPEERTKLQRVRDTVVSSGGQLGVTLAGAVLGNVMGV